LRKLDADADGVAETGRESLKRSAAQDREMSIIVKERGTEAAK